MRYTILFSISILMLVSCKKDKYKTIPTLKFESVNTRELRFGNILKFTLSFTDKEGDLTDSIYIEKFEPKCANSGYNELRALPAFSTSKNQNGEIVVSYGYRVSGFPLIKEPQCGRNDTAVFRFVLKDKAQNKSDTIVSPTIVIYK